jgi:hypothetical protein
MKDECTVVVRNSTSTATTTASSDDDDNDVPLIVRQKLAQRAQQRNFENASLPPSEEYYETIASEHDVDVRIVREIFAHTPRIEEAEVPKQKRQSAINASTFIQNNVDKDDDDDAEEEEEEEEEDDVHEKLEEEEEEEEDINELTNKSSSHSNSVVDMIMMDNVKNGIWQGISEEIEIPVACGDSLGTLILPKKYKNKQERIVCNSNSITPSQFEALGGRGNAKKWKSSIFVVSSNGSHSQSIGNFIIEKNLHPFGHKMEDSTSDNKTPTTVLNGNDSSYNKTAANNSNVSADDSDDGDFKSAQRTKSKEFSDVFSVSLSGALNSSGGIKSIEALSQYTELMKSCSDAQLVKNADQKRVVMLAALLRTDVGVKEKKILNMFVGGDTGGEALDLLASWLNDSADRYSSSVLVSILRSLKMLPVTTKALMRTQLGKSVRKLKKYIYVTKDDDSNVEESKEQAEKVPKLAEQLMERWKQRALEEEKERVETEKRAEASKKRKIEQEKKDAEKDTAAEKEKKKAKVQLKDTDDIVDVLINKQKDAEKKNTTMTTITTTTVTRTVVSRPAIVASTTTTSDTLKKRKVREAGAPGTPDGDLLNDLIAKPKQTNIGGVGSSLLFNASTSMKDLIKPNLPSALMPDNSKKKIRKEKCYFETHLAYSDDPNEVKFKHKSERKVDGKAKPKKKALTWAEDSQLEAVRIFEKDKAQWQITYRENAVAELDDDSDASVEAALKRKAREEDSERHAAQKARKRKMEQMRPTTSWKIPKTLTRDKNLVVACGEDSRELHRVAGIVARKKAVKYENKENIPDSPAEAPEEDAKEDDMIEIPIQLVQVSPPPLIQPPPPQQQQQQQHQQQHQQHQQYPPPPPPNVVYQHQMPSQPVYITQQPPPIVQYHAPPPPPQQQQHLQQHGAAPLDQNALQALLNQFNQKPSVGAPVAPVASSNSFNSFAPGVPGSFNSYVVPPSAGTSSLNTAKPVVTTLQNASKRGVCAFFNSATGCNWGDKCGFLHQAGISSAKPTRRKE